MKPKGLGPKNKRRTRADVRMIRIFSLLRELEKGINMYDFCLRYKISERQLDRDIRCLDRAGYPVYIPEDHFRKLLKGPCNIKE